MNDPTDLVAWLTACYDRAEQRARAAFEGDPMATGHWHAGAMGIAVEDGDQGVTVAYDEGAPTEAQAAHIADHDPSWRLADIALKRKILAMHCTVELENEEGYQVGEGCAECNHFTEYGACDTVRVLAEEFASEPGYQEAWRR